MADQNGAVLETYIFNILIAHSGTGGYMKILLNDVIFIQLARNGYIERCA